MGSGRDNAEATLIAWRADYEQRDAGVRKTHKEKISIHRIHVLTGIGRSTIYRILGAPPPTKAAERRHATRE